MQVQSLGCKDPLEEEMATHSSILAWEIPWTEESGGLQSTGSQSVGFNLATKQQFEEEGCYEHLSNIYLTSTSQEGALKRIRIPGSKTQPFSPILPRKPLARDLPGGPVFGNPPDNARDTGLIPGLGRSSGEAKGYPLRYSCLENPMDRGVWRATVDGVAESWHD